MINNIQTTASEVLGMKTTLHEIAIEINANSEYARDLEQKLLTLVAGKGVGLAATQIGVATSMAVMQLGGPAGNWIGVCNPTYIIVTDKDGKMEPQYSVEGCLSILNPDITNYLAEDRYKQFVCQRASNIIATYEDTNGQPHSLRLTGFDAVIWQHEIDHLNGILICDHGKAVVPAELTQESKEDSK